MSKELIRLTASLHNTPHLVSPQLFDTVMQYITARNMGQENMGSDYESDSSSGLLFNADTGVGVLEIHGPLTNKPIRALCAGDSVNYQTLVEDTQALADAGATVILMDIDSGGGEAYGCFEAAAEMRKICTQNDIQLIAYVDGMAASAAYALACIADEIVVNPQAEVGSVGVVVRLMNDSKALEKEGFERTFVFAGDSKVPYAEDGSFREDFISDIQGKVDALYGEFVDHVSLHRDMNTNDVRATQAKTFLPSAALEIGLADTEMNRFDFFDYLAQKAEPKNNVGSNSKLNKSQRFKLSQEEQDDMTLAELQAQVADLQAKNEALQAEGAGLGQKLAQAASDLESAVAAMEAAQAELSALKDVQAQAASAARKARLEGIIGTAELDSTFAALESLPEAAFEAVVKTMESARAVETKSALFTEVGAKEAAETGKNVPQLSAEAQILQAKYGKQS